jgi:hypothetical protein
MEFLFRTTLFCGLFHVFINFVIDNGLLIKHKENPKSRLIFTKFLRKFSGKIKFLLTAFMTYFDSRLY